MMKTPIISEQKPLFHSDRIKLRRETTFKETRLSWNR